MIPAQPSRTAHRVALHRAAHQLLDKNPVFRDPLAIQILGEDTAAALRADPLRFESERAGPYLRAFLAARSRFAEDRLAAARDAGVRQYVILGAGLDTFAYRDPTPGLPLHVWEVDHPATQAWKRELLQAARIAIPPQLDFVAVDFERQALPEALAAAGFDPAAGAVVSWLGVTPYLTPPAVLETLRFLARVTRAAGGVAFDYALAPHLLTPREQQVFAAFAARVRAAGEPWQSSFDPAALAHDLRAMGFAVTEDLPPEALNARYFAGRTDGLRVGSLAHLMWAGAAPEGREGQQALS
jgi:methyltransferase (TIGR00027 family)